MYIVGETVFCLNTIYLFLFCPSPLLGTLTAQKSFHGFSILTRGRHRWPLWKPLSRVFALGHSDCISYLWRDESHIDLRSKATRDAMIRYVFESRKQLCGEKQITE